MTTVNIRGFTIIELMLFLAVSGGLFAALLLGVNNGVVQQRYKDSVYSYSSFLQNQYSEVLNTRNEARTQDLTCDSSVVSTVPAGGVVQQRGTSNCVTLGKLIVVNNPNSQESTIKSYTVVGTCTSTPPDNKCVTNEFNSDIEALSSYNPKIISVGDVGVSTVSMEWGSWLARKDASSLVANGHIASYLILRSPLSGLIKVFVSSLNDIPSAPSSPDTPDIQTFINSATNSSVMVCVMNQNKGLQPTSSVTLDSSVSGPNGVTVKSDGVGC